MQKSISAFICCIACTALAGCSLNPFAHKQIPQVAIEPNSNNVSGNGTAQNPGSSANATQQDTGDNSQNASDHSQGTGDSSTTSSVSVQKPSLPPVPMLRIGKTGEAVLELQILLAQTGYLPLKFTSESGTGDNQSGQDEGLTQGKWTWSYKTVPKDLTALWSPTKYTQLTESAVMTFESAHHLTVDGIAGPKVWEALQSDTANHVKSEYGFTFVEVSLQRPQSLMVWHNGAIKVTTPVNSGIPQSPTVKGTYPVYVQYLSQTMSGVDVFGHKYSDPGVPYVSYFYKGEAIHGFPRASYGYPQSLGCVELPIPAAKRVWPYVHLGTLVHIS